MPTLLIVEKSGNIKELNVKQYVEEDLYKKAGFKSDTGFKCQTTWNVEIDQKKWDISVFAKTTGRAGQENKYDFPPPVDSTLFLARVYWSLQMMICVQLIGKKYMNFCLEGLKTLGPKILMKKRRTIIST
jgi:hypothetical protein